MSNPIKSLLNSHLSKPDIDYTYLNIIENNPLFSITRNVTPALSELLSEDPTLNSILKTLPSDDKGKI